MWGKVMIPMYRLWLHSLYGLCGPRYPLSKKKPINLITHSLWIWYLFCPSIVSELGHHQFGNGLLPEPMLTSCQLEPQEHISMESSLKFKYFPSRKWVWICCLQNFRPFCSGLNMLKGKTSYPCDKIMKLRPSGTFFVPVSLVLPVSTLGVLVWLRQPWLHHKLTFRKAWGWCGNLVAALAYTDRTQLMLNYSPLTYQF